MDYAVYLVVRVILCAVQALPLRHCERVASTLGFIAHSVFKIRRQITLDNLQHAMPELSEHHRSLIARQMWTHLFTMLFEVAHARRRMHRTNWRNYVKVDDQQRIVNLMLNDRPTVLVSAHFGNFEIAGYVSGLLGFPTYTIARALDNPYLNTYLTDFRAANGQYIVDKDGAAYDVDNVLKHGGTLALLGDKHAGPKGLWAEFLNRPASCHKAIALFSLGKNAPMMVIAAVRDAGMLEFHMKTNTPFDPEESSKILPTVYGVTRWYNDELAQMIRQYPSQYWWLHRRWKGKPRGSRKRMRKAG